MLVTCPFKQSFSFVQTVSADIARIIGFSTMVEQFCVTGIDIQPTIFSSQ